MNTIFYLFICLRNEEHHVSPDTESKISINGKCNRKDKILHDLSDFESKLNRISGITLLQPLPSIRSFVLYFLSSILYKCTQLQVVRVATDLFDKVNQPNLADNRRVSLVCPD